MAADFRLRLRRFGGRLVPNAAMGPTSKRKDAHLGLPASLKKQNKSSRECRKERETLVWTLGRTQAQARSLGDQPEAVGAHAAPVRCVGPCGSGREAASSRQGSHESHLRLFKGGNFF